MKIKNIFLQKEISFWLLIILGFNYLIFLFIFSIKVLPAFLMQLILIIDAVKNKSGLNDLLSSLDLYISLIATLIMAYLWLKTFRSIRDSIKGLRTTNRIIKALNIKTLNDINIVKSKEEFVFTAGILSPKIYISKKLKNVLNEEELNSVIAHEQYHKKNFDPLRRFVVELIKKVLFYFPGKKSIFSSFFVLTELSADYYAEQMYNSKRSIVSALYKITNSNIPYLEMNVSAFNLENSRVEILVGKSFFKSKNFFLAIFLTTSFLFINTMFVKDTNILLQCQHVIECFNALFSENDKILPQNREVCLRSNNLSSEYHCIKFTEALHT